MAVGVKLVCQEQLSNLRPGEWESILVCKEILVGWWLRHPATTGGPEVTSRMRLQPPWANKPTGMDGKDSKLHANHLTRYGRMHWDIELMTYSLEKTKTTKCWEATAMRASKATENSTANAVVVLWQHMDVSPAVRSYCKSLAPLWIGKGVPTDDVKCFGWLLPVFIFLGWRHVHLQVRKHFAAGEFTLKTLGFGWLWSFPSFRRRHGLHWMFADNLDASHIALENAAYTTSKCHPKQRLVGW